MKQKKSDKVNSPYDIDKIPISNIVKKMTTKGFESLTLDEMAATLVLENFETEYKRLAGKPWVYKSKVADRLNHAKFDLKTMSKQYYKSDSSIFFNLVHKGDKSRVQDFMRQNIKYSNEMLNLVDSTKKTALHISAKLGHYELTEFLIKKRFSVLARDKFLRTPLHLACQFGHSTVAGLLIKGKSDLNARDNHGRTVIHFACSSNSIQLVVLLLGYKPDLSMSLDSYDRTPLHYIVWNKNPMSLEIANKLLDAGCDVNAVDFDGLTPLHYASDSGLTYIIPFLLRNGARLDIKDLRNNMTPVELACNEITREVILAYSGKPHKLNNEDREVLDKGLEGIKVDIPMAKENDKEDYTDEVMKRGERRHINSKQKNQGNNASRSNQDKVEKNINDNAQFDFASINRAKLIDMLKQIQEYGVKSMKHVENPSLYTGSWVEKTHNIEDFHENIKNMTPNEAILGMYNILFPYGKEYPDVEVKESKVASFFSKGSNQKDANREGYYKGGEYVQIGNLKGQRFVQNSNNADEVNNYWSYSNFDQHNPHENPQVNNIQYQQNINTRHPQKQINNLNINTTPQLKQEISNQSNPNSNSVWQNQSISNQQILQQNPHSIQNPELVNPSIPKEYHRIISDQYNKYKDQINKQIEYQQNQVEEDKNESHDEENVPDNKNYLTQIDYMDRKIENLRRNIKIKSTQEQDYYKIVTDLREKVNQMQETLTKLKSDEKSSIQSGLSNRILKYYQDKPIDNLIGNSDIDLSHLIGKKSSLSLEEEKSIYIFLRLIEEVSFSFKELLMQYDSDNDLHLLKPEFIQILEDIKLPVSCRGSVLKLSGFIKSQRISISRIVDVFYKREQQKHSILNDLIFKIAFYLHSNGIADDEINMYITKGSEKTSVSMSDLTSVVNSTQEVLSKQEVELLFKCSDLSEDGTIDLNTLIENILLRKQMLDELGKTVIDNRKNFYQNNMQQNIHEEKKDLDKGASSGRISNRIHGLMVVSNNGNQANEQINPYNEYDRKHIRRLSENEKRNIINEYVEENVPHEELNESRNIDSVQDKSIEDDQDKQVSNSDDKENSNEYNDNIDNDEEYKDEDDEDNNKSKSKEENDEEDYNDEEDIQEDIQTENEKDQDIPLVNDKIKPKESPLASEADLNKPKDLNPKELTNKQKSDDLEDHQSINSIDSNRIVSGELKVQVKSAENLEIYQEAKSIGIFLNLSIDTNEENNMAGLNSKVVEYKKKAAKFNWAARIPFLSRTLKDVDSSFKIRVFMLLDNSDEETEIGQCSVKWTDTLKEQNLNIFCINDKFEILNEESQLVGSLGVMAKFIPFGTKDSFYDLNGNQTIKNK